MSSTWAALMRQAAEAAALGLHTSMPAVVLAYADGVATVQPLAKRAFLDASGARQISDLPPLEGCPVQFPGGGGFEVSWPLQPGDEVMLDFAERSLEGWRAAPPGQTYDPEDARHHHLSDAVVRPRLYRGAPKTSTPRALTIAHESGTPKLQLTAEGLLVMNDGVSPAVRGTQLKVLLQALSGALGAIPGGAGAVSSWNGALTAAETAGLFASKVLL